MLYQSFFYYTFTFHIIISTKYKANKKMKNIDTNLLATQTAAYMQQHQQLQQLQQQQLQQQQLQQQQLQQQVQQQVFVDHFCAY